MGTSKPKQLATAAKKRAAKKVVAKRVRSADTGQFVEKEQATTDPKGTVEETITPKGKAP